MIGLFETRDVFGIFALVLWYDNDDVNDVNDMIHDTTIGLFSITNGMIDISRRISKLAPIDPDYVIRNSAEVLSVESDKKQRYC